MKNDYNDMSNLICVNKKGERYVNETASTQTGSCRPCHDKSNIPELDYDGIALEYENLPLWHVFDETRRAYGPICSWSGEEASTSWNGRFKSYTWSQDNQAEIDKGWILKADTIEDLAEQMGADPETLAATVSAYNAACAGTAEDEFGRTKNLTPVQDGPFYAIEMTLAFVNCNGGATRDGEHHILDYEGNPIPRLYGAGEFGSLWSRLYHGALNVPEAMCGYAAGAKVAALDSWDA